MDPSKLSERTRKQLETLTPEKRVKAEAVLARIQSPEYRAGEVGPTARPLTENIARPGRSRRPGGNRATAEDLRRFLVDLRREREARGMSLADVADRSGIDRAALSRLENGRQLNPTVNTLSRYARALGKRLALSTRRDARRYGRTLTERRTGIPAHGPIPLPSNAMQIAFKSRAPRRDDTSRRMTIRLAPASPLSARRTRRLRS